MKNKMLAVAILGGLLVAVGIFFIFKSGTTKVENEKKETSQTEEATPTKGAEMLTWKDEAGFLFNYPADLKIKQNTEDNESYSNLEITKEGKEGKITILAKDTKLKSIDEWNKEKAANKIGRIDQGILFTIEADPGWETEMGTIDKSWQFFYPTKAESAKEEGGEVIEEVVE
jgi:hypothetical protein